MNDRNADSTVYVAGHRGMVGSAIVRRLVRGGYTNVVTRTRDELNLLDQSSVQDFMWETRPDVVYLAAARVGGILANTRYPANFIYENLCIQTNIIHAAAEVGVGKLIFLGSSCIYPRLCPQPIRERDLLSGPLESTNEPYAVAKIAGIKLCEAYNRQFGTRYVSLMPTNLYGPNDTYDLQNSHVIPALLRKMHEAKNAHAPTVEVWGSGTPRREFLHVDDLANACVFAAEQGIEPGIYNVGTGRDVSIAELAGLIKDVTGFSGSLCFDDTKPDGTPRKLLDVSRLAALGWEASIGLRDGLTRTYKDFARRYAEGPFGIVLSTAAAGRSC